MSLSAEPYKIKAVEPIKITTREFRERAIKEAGYNTFLLKSEDVFVDLLTDSGTAALSNAQWSYAVSGDEAVSGSKSFRHLETAVREVLGFQFVLPTHLARGAENILSKCLIKPGQYLPGNMYNLLTRIYQEIAGGQFIDVAIDEAYEPDVDHPFKGNIDIYKLEKLIHEVGSKRIPYVRIQTCPDMSGGQPISMANLKDTHELCKRNGIKIVLEGSRTVENAYFIKEREADHKNKSIGDIVREIYSFADIIIMSTKKDALANVGGFLATNDEDFFAHAKNYSILFEGAATSGGLTGYDLETMARGLFESIADDFHISWRVMQVQYLGEKLRRSGVPILLPVGGHAVFIDAKRFLHHLPQNGFPAQSLAAALYIEAGIRGQEKGTVSAGRDRKTGDHKYPKMELVRLAIPPRVYTNSHLDVVAEALIKLYSNRKNIKGLRMIYEPENFRNYEARFELI